MGCKIINFLYFVGRVQFLREKKFRQTIPKVRVNEGRDGDEEIRITNETASNAMRRATNLFAALQSDHGHWPAENSGPLFYFPPLVLY